MRMRLVAGVSRVTRRGVEQRIAHLLLVERLFGALRIAVAELRVAVEGEHCPAVGREQLHLFTGQQCGRVEKVNECQGTTASGKPEVQLDLDEYRGQRAHFRRNVRDVVAVFLLIFITQLY